MNAANIVAVLVLGAIIIYTLSAGADFGAGFWDAWCSGPRAKQQRHLIEQAIQPIWETNHVWLILLVVLMFAGFPSAFSTIGVALAIPLFLILLGIVSRGASYVFRGYSVGSVRGQLHWARIFSASSSITPLFLGIVVGAISGDQILLQGQRGWNAYFQTWLRPTPICIGLLSLSLFSYLAACYLVIETKDQQLQNDFRLRALISGASAGAVAVLTLVISSLDAIGIRDRLLHDPLVLLIQMLAVIVSAVAFGSLLHRRFHRARRAAMMQVTLIVLGWGRAQFPFLVRPNITIAAAAAPANIMIDLIIACVAGSVILLPSLALLFYVFKVRQPRLTPSDLTNEMI